MTCDDEDDDPWGLEFGQQQEGRVIFIRAHRSKTFCNGYWKQAFLIGSLQIGYHPVPGCFLPVSCLLNTTQAISLFFGQCQQAALSLPTLSLVEI